MDINTIKHYYGHSNNQISVWTSTQPNISMDIHTAKDQNRHPHNQPSVWTSSQPNISMDFHTNKHQYGHPHKQISVGTSTQTNNSMDIHTNKKSNIIKIILNTSMQFSVNDRCILVFREGGRIRDRIQPLNDELVRILVSLILRTMGSISSKVGLTIQQPYIFLIFQTQVKLGLAKI